MDIQISDFGRGFETASPFAPEVDGLAHDEMACRLWETAFESPVTLTITGGTYSLSRRMRLPIGRVEPDYNQDGFPWPFRKDGRVNHWYLKAVKGKEA